MNQMKRMRPEEVASSATPKLPCAATRWTEQEDAALKEAVAKYGARKWKLVADIVGSRNHVQCAQRWLKALRPGLQKGQWRPEEDHLLLTLVQEHGTRWKNVAAGWRARIDTESAAVRTIKQIRERWNNNVNPAINRTPFTPEEDQQILGLQKIWGNAWSQIAKCLPGRVGEAVKARHKSLQRRMDHHVGTPKAKKPKVAEKIQDAADSLNILKTLTASAPAAGSVGVSDDGSGCRTSPSHKSARLLLALAESALAEVQSSKLAVQGGNRLGSRGTTSPRHLIDALLERPVLNSAGARQEAAVAVAVLFVGGRRAGGERGQGNELCCPHQQQCQGVAT
jgi:myb proto-oncogene protein